MQEHVGGDWFRGRDARSRSAREQEKNGISVSSLVGKKNPNYPLKLNYYGYIKRVAI